MEQFDFDSLGNEVMAAAFEDAWRIDMSETDGSRSYAVNATRQLFEAAGVRWEIVARASTKGNQRASAQNITEQGV